MIYSTDELVLSSARLAASHEAKADLCTGLIVKFPTMTHSTSTYLLLEALKISTFSHCKGWNKKCNVTGE